MPGGLRYCCPDCHGEGVGCCINADIPLPGVEYVMERKVSMSDESNFVDNPLPGDIMLDIGNNPDHNQRDRVYGFGFFDSECMQNMYSLMITGERNGQFRSAWTHMTEDEVRTIIDAMSDWLKNYPTSYYGGGMRNREG